MTTEDFKRKLTAILSADVVGYSRLMGDDEAATVKTLETYKGVMFSLIRQHRGRVVDSPGDNLLAEFGSVVDAVQCAVSIQKELQTRNADLPENRRMEFRIGINLGDVIEEQDRIYGDGVNVAARLEALCDPGGICVSKTAFDQIESKLPLGYEYMGEQTVKNIPKPIGAYRVLMEPRVTAAKGVEEKKAFSFWRRKSVLSLGIIVILAIAAILYWKFYPRGVSIEPVSVEPDKARTVVDVKETPKSIAVLPFDDLSPEKDQEYFVDGLSEEILNSLAQIPDLTVIAKTSSFSFKGKDKTIQEIASVLGVENILEGSVRKAGNTLRITAQLIKAADGSHLWSKTYDKAFNVEEMFLIQEDIASAVANELKITLGIGKSLKKLGGTENLEAYEAYLIALGQAGVPTYTAISQALESIDTAISLDPEFALALAVKSFLHSYLSIVGPPKHNLFEQDEALKAALKAIDIEPNLAAGHYQLGWMKTSRGEFVEAELAYRKAFELTTDHFSSAFEAYPLHYFAVGYFVKANKLIEEYLQKNPLDQNMRSFYILTFDILGNLQRAEEEYKLGLSLFGDQWFWGKAFMTFVRLGAGDIGSRDDIPEIPMLDPIWANAKGHFESPEEGLEELHRFYEESDNLYNWPYGMIMMWAAYFGDPEFAMEAVKKDSSLNSQNMMAVWLPIMKDVRQLPRFKEFIREVGLVDYWNEFGWPDICRELDNGDFECD